MPRSQTCRYKRYVQACAARHIPTTGRTITPSGSNCRTVYTIYSNGISVYELYLLTTWTELFSKFRLHTCPFLFEFDFMSTQMEQQQCECTTSILARKSRLAFVTVRRCSCVTRTSFHLVSTDQKKKRNIEYLWCRRGTRIDAKEGAADFFVNSNNNNKHR